MILNILIHKNNKIDCFTQPIFIDIEPEKVALQESRSIQIADDGKQILTYKYLTLYYLGTFDDSTGKFDLLDEPRALLDCKDLVKKRLGELGWTPKVSKDGIVANV